jgi:hypothetical protein
MRRLTAERLRNMPAGVRDAYRAECDRILRDTIHADAAAATAPKSGVLGALRDGQRGH